MIGTYGGYDGVTPVLIPHMTPTLTSSPSRPDGKQSVAHIEVVADQKSPEMGGGGSTRNNSATHSIGRLERMN